MATQKPLFIRVEGTQPILNVKDITASAAFYKNTLGFREEEAWSNESFTALRRDAGCIFLSHDQKGCHAACLWVSFYGDIHALHAQLLELGVTIRMPPTNYPWALEMHIEDPDGHVLRLGTDPIPADEEVL